MISISNLTKTIGGQVLYKNASFQIKPGDKIGLVGPNGTGKTTFFRMIMNEESYDEGTISVPEKTRIAYFSQQVGEMHGKTALQEVIEGNKRVYELDIEIKKIEKILEESVEKPLSDNEMDKVLDKLGIYQTEFEKLGGYEVESNAKEILTGLRIDPEDHEKMVEDFSGGWKMRIALAKILILIPDLILMDEPTNYLDLESIIWLETWLKEYKGSVLMTSHDREFMNNVVTKVVEVANKQVTSYTGNLDYYYSEREVRRKQLSAAYNRQREMLSKEEEFIAKFQARASHAAQVQSRVKKLDKIDRIELPPEEEVMNFTFPKPDRGSNDVVIVKDLSKSWFDTTGKENKVFSGLTTTVNRLEKVAVVGVNGAGKSSLLKVICGHTDATEGVANLGPSIKLGYFSQYSLEVLNPENTIFDEVRSRLANDVSDGYIRNLLAAFLFKGDDVLKKVKVLSGGEKSRLVLAVLLSSPHNLLVLDEPTNHLDILSRGVLLDALKAYEGTVLIVSHDRHFLNQLANKVYEVDKGGIRVFEGGYQYYADKKLRESKVK